MKKIAFLLFYLTSLFASEEAFPIDVDVYVNDEIIGKADLLLNPTSEKLTFIPYAISQAVSTVLNEEGVSKLTSFLNQLPSLETEEVVESDLFSLEVSSVDQSLRITADPHLIALKRQSVQKKSLQDYDKNPSKQIDESSRSGYLNVLFGEKFYKTEYPEFTYARREENGNIDGVINFHNWVLQGFAYYVAKGESKFNRGNVLLTHDFPTNNIRLSIGDINTLGIGYQNTVPMAGVSVHKNMRLFTDATVGPTSRHEIFLNVPSRVDIIVDGIAIKTLQLRAGPYLLENFPIVDGMNDVVLKITSPTGEERTVDLGYFYNAQVLAAGQSEYFISLGVPTFENGFQKYGHLPLFSANYQYGITNSTNISAYLQGTNKNMFFGGEGAYSNQYFNFLCDLGGSYVNSTQVKTRLLISKSNKKKSFYDWRAAIEYTDPNFSYLGSRISMNQRKMTYSGSVLFNFWKNANVSLVSEYLNNRGAMNTFYIQAIASGFFKRFLSVKLIGKYERLIDGRYEKSIAFNIDLMPKIKDVTVRSNYNSMTKTFMTDVNYLARLSENRSIGANLGYQKGEGAEIAKGGAKYDGNYLTLNGSHYLALLSTNDNKSTVKVTAANVGTSFVFAEDTLAISRPIKDSFVMIAPNKHLKGQTVLVNPGYRKGSSAKASYYMPAVLPLSSYRDTTIQLTADGNMVGQSFENETIEVRPSYKSGSLLKIGEPPTHIIEGTLVDEKGSPIVLRGGILVDYKNEKRPCYSFFTDEGGKFQLVGVPDGEFEVKVLKNQKNNPVIKIHGDIFIELGMIVLEFGEDM